MPAPLLVGKIVFLLPNYPLLLGGGPLLIWPISDLDVSVLLLQPEVAPDISDHPGWIEDFRLRYLYDTGVGDRVPHAIPFPGLRVLLKPLPTVFVSGHHDVPSGFIGVVGRLAGLPFSAFRQSRDFIRQSGLVVEHVAVGLEHRNK